MKIINTPAIRWINNAESPLNSCCNHCPKNDAPIPKLRNTRDTPSKKKTEWLSNLLLIWPFFFPSNSLTLTPVMYDKYAGKIGSTHGDKNDNAPAPNDKSIQTISIVSASIPPIMTPSFYDI